MSESLSVIASDLSNQLNVELAARAFGIEPGDIVRTVFGEYGRVYGVRQGCQGQLVIRYTRIQRIHKDCYLDVRGSGWAFAKDIVGVVLQ